MKSHLTVFAAGLACGYVLFAYVVSRYLGDLGYTTVREADLALRDYGRVVGVGMN